MSEVLPGKEMETALKVAKVVFKEKDGHFNMVPAGVGFGANGVSVAGIYDMGAGPILFCNDKIEDELRKEGLVFKDARQE